MFTKKVSKYADTCYLTASRVLAASRIWSIWNLFFLRLLESDPSLLYTNQIQSKEESNSSTDPRRQGAATLSGTKPPAGI
jgi:hypothetical protein